MNLAAIDYAAIEERLLAHLQPRLTAEQKKLLFALLYGGEPTTTSQQEPLDPAKPLDLAEMCALAEQVKRAFNDHREMEEYLRLLFGREVTYSPTARMPTAPPFRNF